VRGCVGECVGAWVTKSVGPVCDLLLCRSGRLEARRGQGPAHEVNSSGRPIVPPFPDFGDNSMN